ncbi:MAG: RelA/SpoT family protein [Anaeroplasmataceae bacterium]
MSVTFSELFEEINTYIHKESDLNLIKKAYEFAALKHKDQYRKSGEAYIVHPLAVTMILAQMHVGPNTLVAGLLHDVVEDTDTTLEDIAKMYNPDVASIVDGVTKVNQLVFTSLEKKQVATHQKMLIAMSQDIRVIIVKLADRLHNMRTMEFMKPESQVRISRETLEIYAPLAHKLGMFTIKAELEDRSLRYLDPDMFFKISSLIKAKEDNQDDIIGVMIDEIREYLKVDAPNLVDFSIKGRIKGIYSIYKKMVSQNKRFEDIYDVYAIRLIVNEVGECYQCLGIIHSHYTPIPARIKDYIAVPKSNMYQSLHTTIIGKFGQPVEIQIRTHEMDEIAELGVAAHWAYKENVAYSKDKEQFEIAQKLKWYGEILNYSEESQDENEFVESVRGDILDRNIYVYTPNGEVIDLVAGSTPIDFAYRIHTNLGNTTVGATVNGRIVPLSYELHSGDIVNIRTSKTSYGPSEDWLNIVKTTNAKHKIRAFLNKQNKDILVAQGKDNLDKELSFRQINLEITDRFVKENFSKNNLQTAEDLYLEIGKGLLSSKTVCNKIVGQTTTTEEALQKQIDKSNKILTTNSETGVIVEGLKNPLIKLGNCCCPIPGDKIYGYISKGKGIAVHRDGCKNLESLDKKRLLLLNWATNIDRKYVVYIKITAHQSPTLLTDIINAVSANKMSISSINAINDDNLTTLVKLKLLTTNTLELDKLIVNLKKITSIINIERDYQ